MKISLIAAVVFLAALPNFANALDTKDVAKCSAITGDLDRLTCFDELSKASGTDAPQPLPVETAGNGKWIVTREKNPLDDTEQVMALLIAEEGKSRWGDRIAFIARCKSNETEAFINWHDYLGNDGDIYSTWKKVTTRIGGEKAETGRWSLSTDSKATFAPNWAGALLKQMAASNTFLAQATPYNESPVTAIFDTAGMKAALAPLAEVCGWEF